MTKMAHTELSLLLSRLNVTDQLEPFLKRFSSQLIYLLLIRLGSGQTETKLSIHFWAVISSLRNSSILPRPHYQPGRIFCTLYSSLIYKKA